MVVCVLWVTQGLAAAKCFMCMQVARLPAGRHSLQHANIWKPPRRIIRRQFGVTATGIGSGMSNTTTADSTCDSGAIQVAAGYENNSKRDWHLPSKDELAQLYIQRTIVGFSTLFYYWSSSEYDGFTAWGQEFGSGDVRFNNKDFPSLVRPVRAFG
jgi:hypothetical protein